MKVCPVAGCELGIQRSRDVLVRDDRLREQLCALPATMERVWLQGDEVVTRDQPVETIDVTNESEGEHSRTHRPKYSRSHRVAPPSSSRDVKVRLT